MSLTTSSFARQIDTQTNTCQLQKPAAILNYVWIDSERQTEDKSLHDYIHPEYFKNMAYIANAHPEMDVILWADFLLLNEDSKKGLSDFCETIASNNLIVQDLNDIPAYANDPLFKRKVENTSDWDYVIWLKVDCARVLVMAHDFETRKDTDVVFYSDMDLIQPPFIESQTVIHDKGMVFGRPLRMNIENQFMGFRRSAIDHLYSLQKTTREFADINRNGWVALGAFLRERFPDFIKVEGRDSRTIVIRNCAFVDVEPDLEFEFE